MVPVQVPAYIFSMKRERSASEPKDSMSLAAPVVRPM